MTQVTVDRYQIADFCRRHHIRRLAFFGLVLRFRQRRGFSMSRRSSVALLNDMLDHAQEEVALALVASRANLANLTTRADLRSAV